MEQELQLLEKIGMEREPQKDLLLLGDLIAHGTHGCFRDEWPSLKPLIDRVYDGSILEKGEYMEGYMYVIILLFMIFFFFYYYYFFSPDFFFLFLFRNIYRGSRCDKCAEAFFWKYQSTLIDYLNFKVTFIYIYIFIYGNN